MIRPLIPIVAALVLSGCHAGSHAVRAETPAPSMLTFTDPDAWTVEDGALSLTSASTYTPPHRSPFNLAILSDVAWGDVTIEIEAMQTGREYGHRDLCFVLGYQSPSRFYYVHLATTPDPHANNIFIVNDAPRTALAPVPERGTDWGTGVWRTIRIEREGDAIRVFVDDALSLEASDATFADGFIGFGSFDDTGRFRNLHVRGERTARTFIPFE
ncbi:MAG: hypothetical protein KDA28_01825 [Phycisphaerales bacterium]|nr:hypothetical protein [Phycisphaerales bacterium]